MAKNLLSKFNKIINDKRPGGMKTRIIRNATSAFRGLPDAIIIGAQKSGTTSLFRYLEQHVQIAGSEPKEVHYFDNHYDLGTLWYRSHFPYKTDSILLESSPYYLCYPHAAKRIYDLLPNVKLIAILRNPTDRAISHYFHQVRAGAEKLPILEAFTKEEDRIQSLWEKILADESYTDSTHQRFSYKQRGIYIEQLNRYWKYFDPENLLVLNSDNFFADPQKTLTNVFDFLEVKPNVETIDFKTHTKGSNKEEVPAEVYDYLNEFFKPYNEQLYQHLGEDFSW
jgi:hypothetical protein